jgi:hypothetical protein
MIDLPQKLEEVGIPRRFAVDVCSVVRGVRRMGLIHAPLETGARLRAVLNKADLAIFAQRMLLRCDDPNSREGILRECRAGEDANFIELWFARPDAGSLPASDALFANPGLHLGYPPCCVAEWERGKSQRDLYRRYIFDTVAGHWEINRVVTVFQGGMLIPDFFPCSLDCEQARAFVAPILALAQSTLDRAWVLETVRWMQAPLVCHSGSLYAFPTWTLADSRLELSITDGVKVPLSAIGNFDDQSQRVFRLVSFRHFALAKETILVGSDGRRTVVALAREST